MSVYLPQCWYCRATVQPSECVWVWEQAGGLTGCRYVCAECDCVTGPLGYPRERAVL